MLQRSLSLPLRRLRRQWLLIALLYLVALLGMGRWLALVWGETMAARWAVGAALLLSIQLGVLWWALPHNHRRGEAQLLPNLGLGTTITLGRGLAVGLMSGFLLLPPVHNAAGVPALIAWLPALLYTVAAVLDFFDGYAARVANHSTRLGELLDMEFDGLGVLVVVALAIHFGTLPLWYAPIGLARQLFVAGEWWRRRTGRVLHPLPPSDERRLIAGYQMGFLTTMLWPLFAPPLTTLAAVLFGLPIVVSFSRDWLVVSGALSMHNARYRTLNDLTHRIATRWLPLAARLAGTALALLVLWQALPRFELWRAFLVALFERGGPWSAVALLLAALLLLTPLALPAFILGALGRLAAFPLVAVAVVDALAGGFALATNGALLAAALWPLQWGSGAWAIAQSDERAVRRQAGSTRARLAQ